MTIIYIASTNSTPLGEIWVAVSENGLVAVEFPVDQVSFRANLNRRHAASIETDPSCTTQVIIQLEEYASGLRREFNLPIDWSAMGDFQRSALQATCAIPFGQTRTYQQVAIQVGSPRAARAVGRAEATNPMPLVIPCHRVVGADGKLHGYGAGQGLSTKTWLLNLEGVPGYAAPFLSDNIPGQGYHDAR
jgi:methylated-DNA-[protein]-cysteine S-methyltransferase